MLHPDTPTPLRVVPVGSGEIDARAILAVLNAALDEAGLCGEISYAESRDRPIEPPLRR